MRYDIYMAPCSCSCIGRLAPANFVHGGPAKLVEHRTLNVHIQALLQVGRITAHSPKTRIEVHDPRLVRHERKSAWSWIEALGHDPAIVISHVVDGRSHALLGHH